LFQKKSYFFLCTHGRRHHLQGRVIEPIPRSVSPFFPDHLFRPEIATGKQSVGIGPIVAGCPSTNRFSAIGH
jgi:hypothetical protein